MTKVIGGAIMKRVYITIYTIKKLNRSEYFIYEDNYNNHYSFNGQYNGESLKELLERHHVNGKNMSTKIYNNDLEKVTYEILLRV